MSVLVIGAMRSRGWRCLPAACAVVVVAGLATIALASGGSIEGRVLQPDGKPAADARVVVLEVDRSVLVDEAGGFVFEDLPAGRYHVQAKSRRFGGRVREVDVTPAARVRVELTLDVSPHAEKVVVTATRSGRGSAEVVQPVNVLDAATLSDKMQPTLGETLAREPGVRSTYFGPGSSRPVIRGQSGGRVRVLEGGLGVGDASTTSPDHAVATDTLGAEQIEVLRGPATLLYGSAAVGGVVNVIDERVPEFAPAAALGGDVNLRWSSAAEERSGGSTLRGGTQHVAWRVHALTRDTDDYEIPGRAVADDPDGPRGSLPNSAVESDGATVGLSWVGDRGFLGGSTQSFDTVYGIPVELEEAEDEEQAGEAGGVRIDLERRRHDLRGGFDISFGFVDGLRFALGTSDYEHAELEGRDVGTRFFNDAVESRLELTHGRGRDRSGVFGLQYGDRELRAVGLEAFLPPSDTELAALFAIEEIQHGALRYELGARLERNEVRMRPTGLPDPQLCGIPRQREYRGVSGSVGVAWVPNETYAVGAGVTRSERAPSAEELYSCGVHVATQSFEVGEPSLGEETALGLDLSLRKRRGRLSGELNLFLHDFEDYVYELATGETSEGLPVFRFTQEDADFYGAEISARLELLHRDEIDLDLRLFGDEVRGKLSDRNENLPRIPPRRIGLGLEFGGRTWRASAEVVQVDDQTRLSPTETATDGYTLVHAAVGLRAVARGVVHDVSLRGSNLTDEQARNHVSRLKDSVPLPGIDLSVIYRLVF